MQPISIRVSYQSEQEGSLKLYYSDEENNFNEENILIQDIEIIDNFSILYYSINDINLEKFRLDLEDGLEKIYISEVVISYCKIPIITYNSEQLVQSCSIVKRVELLLQDETVEVTATNNDPYFGVENIDLSMINQVIEYLLTFLTIMLALLIILNKKLQLAVMKCSKLLYKKTSLLAQRYGKIIYPILIVIIVTLSIIYIVMPISIQVSYFSNQDGVLKFYYSQEEEKFSETNILMENIESNQSESIVSYNFNDTTASNFRFDLEEGLESIYISEVSIKFICFNLISYDAHKFIDKCSIVRRIELTLEDDLVNVNAIGDDPYIGIENINLSIIDDILLYSLFAIIAVFLILLFLNNKVMQSIKKINTRLASIIGKYGKIIYPMIITSIVLLLLIEMLVPISINVSYLSNQDGVLKLYYSKEDESFNEENILLEEIHSSDIITTTSYYIDDTDIANFRLDLEDGIDIIYISEVSIRILGVTLISYDAQQFIDECSIVRRVELTLDEEFVKVEMIGDDPYIGVENIDLSVISEVLQYGLCLISLILLIIAFCEKKYNCKKIVFSLLLIATLTFLLTAYCMSLYFSLFVSILITLMLFALTVIFNFKKQHLFIIMVLSMLFVPQAVYSFCGFEIDESLENSTLSEKPTLTINNIDTFPVEYEEYYDDNIAFKSELVELVNVFEFNLFDISAVENVIKGEDGWLFYTPTIDDFQHTNAFTDEELETIKDNLVSIQEQLAEDGIEFYLMIGPNKNTIYFEYMPSGYIQYDEISRKDALLEYLQEETSLIFVDPTQELLEAKEYTDVYYKWDTHWNEQGAYIGFSMLADTIGLENVPEFSELDFDYNEIYSGDLQIMLNIDLAGVDSEYTIEYKEEINATLVSDESATRYMCYESDIDNDIKLLIFRDSFTTNMEQYISKSFSESVFVWTSFDMDVVETEQPDIVVYELVERNINKYLY